MEKQTLLAEIEQLASYKKITLKELVAAYNSGKHLRSKGISYNQATLEQIFYYLGGAIIFIGISILIGQHWASLTFFTRLMATLGSGIIAYVVGVLLQSNRNFAPIGQAFFLISALVLPLGFYVLLQHFGFKPNQDGLQAIISGILFFFFLISYWIFPITLFIIFNILFGSWLILSLTNFMIGGDPYFAYLSFFSYRTLLLAIVYLLLGYHYAEQEKHTLSGVLYGIGSFVLLSTVLNLSGWKPRQNLFWEETLFILSFVVIFLSVPLRSRALLTIGTFFLMIFIGKLTTEYFVNNLGWPLALVLAGLMMIMIGYTSIRIYNLLNKKIIMQSTTT
jgi:hypothetical protein